MTRYQTIIKDETIYIDVDVGELEIGPIEDLVEFHGETHTVEYNDWEKERYSEDNFADEGLQTPVREAVEQMTHSRGVVDYLKSKPLEESDDGNTGITRRMLCFAGMVRENLDNGIR